MAVEIKNQNDALGVLVNGIKLAVKRGAFEIEEIDTLLVAIKMFATQEAQKVEETVVKGIDTVKEKVKEVETLVQ